MPVRRRAATSSAWRAAPATGRPAARSASCWTTRRRSAGGSSASRSSVIEPGGAPPEPVELGGDEGVEHLGLLAQQLGGAQHVGGGRRVDLGERRGQPVADPVAGVGRLVVAGVVAPGEPALLAVGGRLRPGEAEQRPHQAAVARAHAEQRPAARRGGEPVEDRLDLVVGGVAGGDRRAPSSSAEPLGRPVADLARPGLKVARARAAAGPARPRAAPRAPRRAPTQCSSSASESSRRP